jgi:hypothetical protein
MYSTLSELLDEPKKTQGEGWRGGREGGGRDTLGYSSRQIHLWPVGPSMLAHRLQQPSGAKRMTWFGSGPARVRLGSGEAAVLLGGQAAESGKGTGSSSHKFVAVRSIMCITIHAELLSHSGVPCNLLGFELIPYRFPF